MSNVDGVDGNGLSLKPGTGRGLWRGARRPTARRVGWGFVDQALSSLTNFAVNILIARSVDARGFGIYALMFSAYLLVLGMSRSLCTDPFMVRYAGTGGPDLRQRRAAAVGAALMTGTLAALALAFAAVWLPADIKPSLIAFALVLPGLTMQDAWRVVFFADGRPRKAALNDLIWGVAAAALIVTVLLSGRATVPALILAWGVGGTVAALAGMLQIKTVPAIRQARSWVATNRDLGLPFFGDFLSANGGHQVNAYGLAAVANLATVGTLKAGQILMGPLNVLQMGVSVSVTPEAVRLRERSIVVLRRVLVLTGLAVAAIALIWGATLKLLPDSIGYALLRENWALASLVILPLSVQRAAMGMSDSAIIGLRVLGAAKEMFRLRTAVVALGVVATLSGGWRYGALGAAVGGATAACLASVLWWRKLLLVARSYSSGQVHPPGTGGSRRRGDQWAT